MVNKNEHLFNMVRVRVKLYCELEGMKIVEESQQDILPSLWIDLWMILKSLILFSRDSCGVKAWAGCWQKSVWSVDNLSFPRRGRRGCCWGSGPRSRWPVGRSTAGPWEAWPSFSEMYRMTSFCRPDAATRGDPQHWPSCSLVSSISMEPAFVLRLKLKLIPNLRKART